MRLFPVNANDAIAPERLRGASSRALPVRLLALARSADALALAGLGLFIVGLTVVSWRKWGAPEIDAGAELTTAAQALHGHLPYEDTRYFYGPLGVYTLTGAFKLFGASLATAYALGLAMTMAIAASFFVLARQLLRPLAAALCTAVLIAIGFSGTQFNFVLPHTNSATFGLLLCILTLLALTRGHFLFAGTAIGMTALTRVEFAAAGAFAALAWAAGIWREEDLGAALRALGWIAGPAIAIPVAVLGTLASSVGPDRLFWQNLWPIDFLRAAGFNAYREWTPFDAASVASSLARGAIYLALLAGLTATAVRFHGARGIARAKALWPLAAACASSLVLLAAWKASGLFSGAEAAVQEESKQLLLGMSWLPLLSLLAAALVARALLRRQDAPLSGRWPLDLTLVAVAVLLCSRAYDQFTMDSAAPYYAAPAVLLLGLLHQRVGDRWPSARPAVMAMLAAMAAGVALYSAIALYPDKGTVVHTAVGDYVGDDRAAAAEQQGIDFVRDHTAPGEPILALPADAGMYFLSDRPQALYENMFLPGLIDTAAEERAAIARIEREGVRYALVSTRDTSNFETGRFGFGYDRVLGAYLRSKPLVATFGDVAAAPGGGNPSQGFRVYALR
jgi:hypothetical protein